MLFFYVKNVLLNVVSNNAPIYRDKYPILTKEVTEVPHDILLYRDLYFLYPPDKVLLYIIL